MDSMPTFACSKKSWAASIQLWNKYFVLKYPQQVCSWCKLKILEKMSGKEGDEVNFTDDDFRKMFHFRERELLESGKIKWRGAFHKNFLSES